MKGINQYLHNETKEMKKKNSLKSIYDKDNSLFIKNLIEEYNQWLDDLKQLMENRLFRQVLKDIEEKKNKYEKIKTELWKYRLIKSKAILKIIKIKMRKHYNEIILENSSQNISLKFWFNQIFLTLEELILEFRYDINEHLNYNSKKIIEPIQAIIEYHLEFIYYLCLYSFKVNEVIPLLTYLSIVDRFIPFIPFLSRGKILSYFQNIILFKIKILVENYDFLSSFENTKILFKLFFREMHIFLDVDSEIKISSFHNINKYRNKNKNKNNDGFCRIIEKLTLAYFLRGVACENLGYFKQAIDSYRQCRWYSSEFLFDYNKEIFKFFRNLERKYIIYKEIFYDIRNEFLIKNNQQKYKKIKKTKKKYILSSFRNHNKSGIDSCINTNKSKYHSTIRIKSSAINSPTKRKRLEKLLNNIGNNLYKEEENRNNSIFKKFTKNSFVLSTVNMIDNLLSDQFNHVLKKMKKVEITKPEEEINHLINWTINIKRQKEFKDRLEKLKDSNKHKKYRNNSCIQFENFSINNYYTKNIKQKIKLRNHNASKIDDQSKENTEKSICNNYKRLIKSKSLKNEISAFDNIIKSKSTISLSKNNQTKSIKSYQRKYKKILKYPLNKDVFSKSVLSKKNFLDTFYGKELNFQKKLLKLKGYDIEKNTNNYNHQKAINSAEQDFNIIRCFAESKNTKKNLLNLVKNTNEFNHLEIMFQNKKLRARSNKQLNLKNLNSFMLLNHINPVKEKYNPDNVKQINEEKSKMLNIECAKLELLQNKYEKQKKDMMNKRIRKKRKEGTNFY